MKPADSRKLYALFVRQLLPLLALAFILAAAGAAWVYYQAHRNEANTQREQTLDTFAQVLTKPLWDCDSVTAQGIIEAMQLQHTVHGASAPDQCAQRLIQAGQLPLQDTADTLRRTIQYVDENGRVHTLGELRVAFLPFSVLTAITDGLMQQLIIFFSMLVAALASALWTIQHTVGRPLEQLRQAMRQHHELEPIPAEWAEELTEVTQTYNAQVKELRSQARHDPLTGLGNRLLLEEHLQRAIRRALRTGRHNHILLLDLDRFKSINDAHGHAAGDEVLRVTAGRLLASVRANDTVTRLGGDEFVIITEHSDPDLIQALIQRIRLSVAQPIAWNGIELQVGASIGLAQCGRDGDTAEALLAHADAAMYLSKSTSP
ncbi:GGDEF domain-containing protein [Castellaniella sp.]|uniref:GGDEF domain-containing protein n=1 Tax=Castellaniella sp. TaxID=1955812 RepID=UPI00355F7DD4